MADLSDQGFVVLNADPEIGQSHEPFYWQPTTSPYDLFPQALCNAPQAPHGISQRQDVGGPPAPQTNSWTRTHPSSEVNISSLGGPNIYNQGINPSVAGPSTAPTRHTEADMDSTLPHAGSFTHPSSEVYISSLGGPSVYDQGINPIVAGPSTAPTRLAETDSTLLHAGSVVSKKQLEQVQTVHGPPPPSTPPPIQPFEAASSSTARDESGGITFHPPQTNSQQDAAHQDIGIYHPESRSKMQVPSAVSANDAIQQTGAEVDSASLDMAHMSLSTSCPLDALLSKESPLKIAMVGNPGSGKSTIQNALANKCVFKSGISFGTGMTYQLDSFKSENGHMLFDTPGLSDRQKRKQAADAIQEMLKKGGDYKLIFVITQQNGRALDDDVTTMQLVLEAAPDIGRNFGVIVNQVPQEIVAMLHTDPENMLQFAAATLCSLPEKFRSEHIIYMPHDPDLSCKANVVKPLPANILQFILDTPTLKQLDPETVHPIQSESYEERKELINKLRKQLEEEIAKKRKEARRAYGVTRALKEKAEENKKLEQSNRDLTNNNQKLSADLRAVQNKFSHEQAAARKSEAKVRDLEATVARLEAQNAKRGGCVIM